MARFAIRLMQSPRRHQRLWPHSDPIQIPFPLTNRDLPPLQIHILQAQPRQLIQSQSATVLNLRHQPVALIQPIPPQAA